MEMPDRASASIRLDMSRPVLMTHLAPRDCRSPISVCTGSGIGGLSNSAKSVPSKSVDISLIGKDIVLAARNRRRETQTTRDRPRLRPGMIVDYAGLSKVLLL